MVDLLQLVIPEGRSGAFIEEAGLRAAKCSGYPADTLAGMGVVSQIMQARVRGEAKSAGAGLLDLLLASKALYTAADSGSSVVGTIFSGVSHSKNAAYATGNRRTTLSALEHSAWNCIKLLLAKPIRLVWPRTRKTGCEPKSADKPCAGQLAELMASINKAFAEMDTAIPELARLLEVRKRTVQGMQADLSTLAEREDTLKRKIQAIARTPPLVVDRLATLVDTAERRSARRDYLLCIFSALFSMLIAVIVEIVRRSVLSH